LTSSAVLVAVRLRGLGGLGGEAGLTEVAAPGPVHGVGFDVAEPGLTPCWCALALASRTILARRSVLRPWQRDACDQTATATPDDVGESFPLFLEVPCAHIV
jgi:hypothetical protein